MKVNAGQFPEQMKRKLEGTEIWFSISMLKILWTKQTFVQTISLKENRNQKKKDTYFESERNN